MMGHTVYPPISPQGESNLKGWQEGLDKKTVRMNIRPNGKMISRIILEVRHRMYPTHRVLPVTEKRKGAERLALSLPVIHGHSNRAFLKTPV